jgi:hypothetical protein
MEGCCRFAADTDLESGSKEKIILEEGDRGGHGPETSRGTIELEEAIRQPLLHRSYCWMTT